MGDRFVGKRLDGRYEIHELVGSGGMAYVYRAFDRVETRWVAIKILKEEFSNNNDFLRRFRNESRAIAVLSHPNIVKIYDVSLGDQIQYIVMEYIDGITLKDYIEQQGAIRWQEVVHFMVQILVALESAHEKGIIHRDIKPQNILLLRDGTIKVTDFGIARFSQSQTQTMTDKAIGSVHYISPEQARGDYITNKADIYSTGVMMYEMLTGTLPFHADNAVSVALMQLQAKPRMPREINPAIPRGLEQITMLAMEKNPAMRFASAGAMLDDIERFKEDPAIVFNYEFIASDYTAQKQEMQDISDYQTAYTPDYEDQFEYEEELVKSKRRRKGSMILTGIFVAVLVVAIAVGAVYAINFWKEQQSNEPQTTTVPDFVGLLYTEEVLNNDKYKDFQIIVEQGNNPDKRPGEVLRQDPLPGKTVKKGREVKLTINPTGEPTTQVPALATYKQEDAIKVLELRNLSAKITVESSDDIPVGEVIRTDPKEGSEVPEGTTITLFVSSGPSAKKVNVPDKLQGSTLEDAKKKITDAGLIVGNITYDNSSEEEKDIVISTNPVSGTRVSVGQSIDILVSSGQGAAKTLQMDIDLPQVNEDLTVKVYRDGSKEQEKQINPQYNGTLSISFEGTTGVSNIVVEVNGKEYMYIDFDFDNSKTTIVQKIEYEQPSSQTPVSSATISESSP